VKLVTAATVVAEIGPFTRFRRASQIMGYAGLVPREYSSGASRWRGGITKTGNAHLRRVVVEAAWAYRHPAALKATLRRRQVGQLPDVQDIAWRAQVRLHQKWERLIHRGKGGSVATVAVARELLGFMWAVACAVEAESTGSPAA
jgi:transposase